MINDRRMKVKDQKQTKKHLLPPAIVMISYLRKMQENEKPEKKKSDFSLGDSMLCI